MDANSINFEERRRSATSIQNAGALDSDSFKLEPAGSWLEQKLRPSKITARYPIKGKPLLFATCAFGSLGDALFGYNSGESAPCSR